MDESKGGKGDGSEAGKTLAVAQHSEAEEEKQSRERRVIPLSLEDVPGRWNAVRLPERDFISLSAGLHTLPQSLELNRRAESLGRVGEESYIELMREVSKLKEASLRALDNEKQARIVSYIGGELVAWALAASRNGVKTEPRGVPAEGESIGISLARPKTTALIADRIWDPVLPSGRSLLAAPRRLAVFGASQDESVAAGAVASLSILQESLSDLAASAGLQRVLRQRIKVALGELLERNSVLERDLVRFLSDSKTLTLSVFTSIHDRQTQYSVGDRGVVVGVLERLPIPVETHLSWQQVLDLRSDAVSQDRLRRFTRWLNSSMVAKSSAEIEDELLIKIADYKSALAKHGVETRLGRFERVVSLQPVLAKIAAAGPGVALGDPFLGIIGAGSVLLGEIAFSMQKEKLDLDDVHKRHEDVSFVFELEQAAQAGTSPD